jgi:hypothetical protein
MDLLHSGVDRPVIALWLGHESVETTQMYLHADMRLKEKALALTKHVAGKPGRYRPEDGPQYTGSDCHDLCEDWGVDHTFAPVGRPTGNAVAERFIQTLKVELIWTRDWKSLEELRQAVTEWLHVYNHVRPHQSLDWMTPAEKRAENLGVELETAD